MKAIDFVVRESAGGLQRGTMSADVSNQLIVAGSGQEISINARQSDFASQVRSGDQLVITLSDGRVITIDNFFNDAGAPNRLFVSADGYLNEVSFVDAGQGNLFAQYGPTSEWGKWSPADDLIFFGNSEVAGVPLADGDGDVSMLGAALLGGGSLLGGGAAVAAGVVGAAVLGGIGGGGGDDGDTGTLPAPILPYVNGVDTGIVIGGDDNKTDEIIVTGGGAPGSTVEVTIGDKVVETVIDGDGTFEAVFKDDDFPADGVYDTKVVVTDGTKPPVDLDGPSYDIDLTPPELTFTDGTESTGDFFNAVSFAEGVTITGTGEAGATVAVTIAGVTRTTAVSGTGTWTATWEKGTLEGGEYTTGISAVTTDSHGNSKPFVDKLVVDTLTDVTINSDISTSINGMVVVGDGVVNGVEHGRGAMFSGTAQAGSSVVVAIGTVTHTVTASQSGTWSATFSSTELAAGKYDGSITATATDPRGNVDRATGSFHVDTFVSDLAITSTTGGDDGVINGFEVGNALTVTGRTEIGTTSLIVELNGIEVPATVRADGSWSATFAAGSITTGDYTATMTATATDAAGNVDSATASVRVDTLAGMVTIDSTPVEGDDIVNLNEIIDPLASGVTLTGTSDAGARVTVTMNGVSHTVTTDPQGKWSALFADGEIARGDYTANISATITDPYGNTLSATDSVRVDTRVDNLSVNQAGIAGDNIISASEYNGKVTVTGTTEVGSTSVIVTVGSATVAASGAASGIWTAQFDANALPSGTGTHEINVLATDRAGNTKLAATTVQVDTEVVPFDMTSDPAGDDDSVNIAEAAGGIDLAGTVEAGSRVQVRFDGKDFGLADVDAAGNWSMTIPESALRTGPAYDAEISVTATDRVGNSDRITDTLTIDMDAPDGPVIASHTAVDDGGTRSISIDTALDGSGTADDYSVFEVKGNGAITEVQPRETTDDFLNETFFTFSPTVPNGSNLIVRATDDAGNSSGTYVVLDGQNFANNVDLANGSLGQHQIESLNLDFAEAARVVIDEASLLALSTQTNTLTVHGTREDAVTIEGGEARGTQTVNGQTFNQFAVGAEGTLLIDQDITNVQII